MTTYHGSCHCGAVKYEADVEIKTVTRCTCSLCRKKGALLARVDPEALRIDGEVTVYQFNKRIAKHFYCGKCGIHVFSNPRAAPDKYVINVQTLDDYDVHTEKPEIRVFDGHNWEDAYARSQAKS